MQVTTSMPPSDCSRKPELQLFTVALDYVVLVIRVLFRGFIQLITYSGPPPIRFWSSVQTTES